MLNQLTYVQNNKILALQTAGRSSRCPACVWLTVPLPDTADVCDPALFLGHKQHHYLTHCSLLNYPFR